MMCIGLGNERPHSLWVLHRKPMDDGFELHFIMLCQYPVTGYAYSPLVKLRDGKLLKLWTQFINGSFNLSSPLDPARNRLLTIPKGKRASGQRRVYEVLYRDILQAPIQSRDELVKWLQENQYTVDPSSPTSIRVRKGFVDLELGGFLCSQRFILMRVQVETNNPRPCRNASDSIRVSGELWQPVRQLVDDSRHVGEDSIGK